jgi:antitoxin component of MazEF toxin-antitoxin module
MLTERKNRALNTLDPRLDLMSSRWFGSKIYRQIGEGEELGAGTTVPDGDDDSDGDEPLQSAGLKALEAEKKKRKDLEKMVRQLQQKYSGINPEEIEKLKQESEKREQEELEKQSQYQAALKLKEDKYNQDVQAVRNENSQLQKRLEQTVIEQAVVDAFLASGGKRGDKPGESPKDYVRLLLPAVADQLRVDGDDVIVVDKNGDQRFNPETFKPYTLEDLMSDCRKKGATALFFEPQDKANGSGAYPNSRRVSADKMKELEGLPPAARVARARELGIA